MGDRRGSGQHRQQFSTLDETEVLGVCGVVSEDIKREVAPELVAGIMHKHPSDWVKAEDAQRAIRWLIMTRKPT